MCLASNPRHDMMASSVWWGNDRPWTHSPRPARVCSLLVACTASTMACRPKIIYLAHQGECQQPARLPAAPAWQIRVDLRTEAPSQHGMPVIKWSRQPPRRRPPPPLPPHCRSPAQPSLLSSRPDAKPPLQGVRSPCAWLLPLLAWSLILRWWTLNR